MIVLEYVIFIWYIIDEYYQAQGIQSQTFDRKTLFFSCKKRFLMKTQLQKKNARNKFWQKLHPDFIMYLNWMFLPYRKYMGKKSAKWVAVQCILIRHRLDRILLEAACERQGERIPRLQTKLFRERPPIKNFLQNPTCYAF